MTRPRGSTRERTVRGGHLRGTRVPDLLAGGGEAGARIRSIDWAATPLGPMDTWPQSLLTTLDILLTSRHPMFLWWGPDLIQFYNDAYRPSLGASKYPAAMGQPGKACWPEIWPVIGPLIEGVMERGESVWFEDQLIPIHRNGYLEEVFWTFSYSPVLAEDGRVGGTLVVCSETTGQVRAERRVRTLREIGLRTAGARTVTAAAEQAGLAMATNTADIPFALVYRFEPDARTATLVAAMGIEPTSPAAPASIDLLAASGGATSWPLAAVQGEADMLAVQGLGSRFGSLPGGPYPEAADAALILPIRRGPLLPSIGALVAGLSPRIPGDRAYHEFLVLLADQIGVAISSALTHEEEHLRVEALVEAVRERDEAADRERALLHAIEVDRARLRTLFLQAPAAICILEGPELRMTLLNPLYRRILGEARDVLGKPLREALPELEGQGFFELLDRVYESGEPFIGTELPAQLDRQGDGVLEEAFFNFVYEPTHAATGDVDGVFALAVEVTDQVRARQAAEALTVQATAARQAAEAAVRARDEFLAIAGHELRTPITALRGTAELLERAVRAQRVEPERLARYAAEIRAATDRVVARLDDLLDVVQLQRDQPNLRRERVDLSRLVAESVERWCDQPDGERVRLEVPDGRCEIDADPNRLEQVFDNLLGNALKYSPAGGPILVHLRQAGERWEVAVTDTGIGLPAGAAETIFVPFGRAANATAANLPGMGLGLYIVRQIVEAHGGTVRAESAGEGQGTTVRVFLPRSAETGQAEG